MSFVAQIPEEVIHHSLEGGGGVPQAKEHHCGFEEPSIGAEGSLPLLSFLNPDIV